MAWFSGPAASLRGSCGSVLVPNTELSISEHFLCRYPWPSLRRSYGPVLAYGLPCPTLGRYPYAGPQLSGDVHVRRIVVQSSDCQSQSQLALQSGQARHKMGPMFRRDSSDLVSVEPTARRGRWMRCIKNARMNCLLDSSFGRFDVAFYRVEFIKGS